MFVNMTAISVAPEFRAEYLAICARLVSWYPAALREEASTRVRIEGRYAAYAYWVFQIRPK